MEVKELEKVQAAGIFGTLSQLGHEQVVFCHDESTGLKAIIAIHNTVLGPALGGTRMWNYTSEQEALTDVLRLSRGMTYKAAISGLNLGGGKAVIIGDAKKLKSEAFLRRFGKFVNSLNGKYITAEDVNMKTSDMEYIHMETKHVTGLPESMGGGGDPSPVTAFGVYMGMKATTKKVFGNDSLAGKRVAVQGVGQVGMHLVEHLVKENAQVFITDLFEDKVAAIAKQYGVTAVGQDEIYDLDVDIYAPCALGATINDNTISRLKCSVIAGAANNQLKDEVKHGYMLIDRSITYAPDFLINAGGLINVYNEYQGHYNRKRVFEQAEKIYDTCLNILSLSENEGITSQEAAIRLCEQRIAQIGKVRMSR
ncbi:Glu/Leu/Phe/Val dehydrogenase dimerization domain-containing protein [Chryseosolibacter indicus]|uniref:Glu/Leu/Phe/Val dehydrogenase n=1 Tax=Chryseosolibacter indicus TaxID=2782351 RepID=A0ABS5VQ42_9BACT|nr:Glu/Leu/Phe/Val dehydrogenase dimerization domain-containing protein [Chryseosolibacter indicus]MBT1703572.1 Glu/Leu/Phe/Val dehydrogenase [Chryseosolibacter indicus]